MARIGKYCKAFYVARVREFTGWSENQSIRRDAADLNGKVDDATRGLNEDDFVYLQEDYTVTDGVFADEKFIFTDVTPAWIKFCRNTLKFAPPVSEPAIPAVAEDTK